ncbi:MAG TPA: hypothetical protein VMJ10_01330 [Kofleriaceae bacterium]|nr:hypothetical protein [Kofleriaceae bacterium]
MRFCPFCSAENADELAVCQACGRRLPPLPPRRAGSNKGPPTGIVLPPRATSPSTAPPARRTGTTAPPPIPSAAASPPPPPAEPAPMAHAELLNAISPGPAAERREPPPAEPRIPADRRRSDARASQPPPITIPAPVPVPASPPPSPPPPPPPRAASPVHDTAPTPTVTIEPERASTATSLDGPPPTRIQRSDADRPFAPPKVLAVPEIPEPGLVNAARYAYIFARARWQRRGAIKQLAVEIKQDTEALDQVLGALGQAARGARVEGRVFSAENSAIDAAEERIAALRRELGDVEGRKAEETSKFVDVERERNEKLSEAERQVDEAQRELSQLEGQRRSLRDKRKELERRQRAHLKAAEDQDRQAGSQQMGDQRQELRRAAEDHRREAAALEPERQDIDRKLAGLERPINEAAAKLDAAKAELDAAKRSLNDAREGHTHRNAELDAEQKRKQREIGLAESEIARRLVTLGTLVNLNRIDPASQRQSGSLHPGDRSFAELYERIDRLRGAITARTTEIEKLTAEREAYDRGTLVRGVVVIGGAFVALIALIAIFRAIV